jgi:hypothetical protein
MKRNDMAFDEEKSAVGYGSPPKRSRFAKGQSGNPSGRPKAVASFRSDLTEELHEPHEIFENGQSLKVTKQRAFIKSLTAAAIDNDIRAGAALLACIRHFRVGADEPPPETVDLEDLELVEAYLNDRRKQLGLEKPSTADSPNTESEK